MIQMDEDINYKLYNFVPFYTRDVIVQRIIVYLYLKRKTCNNSLAKRMSTQNKNIKNKSYLGRKRNTLLLLNILIIFDVHKKELNLSFLF